VPLARDRHDVIDAEFIVERLTLGGATRLCFVVAPRKLDIITYYGASVDGIPVCYAIQPEPAGLCDAVFRALPFAAPDEPMAVGLPDTVWFPADALRALPRDTLSFLLFPVEQPELFDAVVTDDAGRVREVIP
jgi:dTDP-glucose pyrophosphorylase